jgi:hypothetical protein
MLKAIFQILKTAAQDTYRSMGTTGIAVLVGIFGALALVWYDAVTGQWAAIRVNWGARVLFGIGLGVLVWLFLFSKHLARGVTEFVIEKRRVFTAEIRVGHRQDPFEFLEAVCALRFTRDVSEKRLVIRMTYLLPIPGPPPEIIYHEPIDHAVRGATKNIRIASQPIQRPGWVPRHALWGEELGDVHLVAGQSTIMPGARSNIEVSIGAHSREFLLEFLPWADNDRRSLIHVTPS